MALRYYALACALLPIVSVHLCYGVSVLQGHLPLCIPYLQECTSISSAGRYGAAYFIFKGTMIPAAMLMAGYWWLQGQWLERQGDPSRKVKHTLVVMGLIASLGLILYCTVLGSIGDIYRMQRRAGIVLYFGITFLAQLILTHRLGLLVRRKPIFKKVFIVKQSLCVCMLLIGLLSLLAYGLYPGYSDIEDIFEWNFALILMVFYGAGYYQWNVDDSELHLKIKNQYKSIV